MKPWQIASVIHMSPDRLPVKIIPSHWLLCCDISIICGCFKFPISFFSRVSTEHSDIGQSRKQRPGHSGVIRHY